MSQLSSRRIDDGSAPAPQRISGTVPRGSVSESGPVAGLSASMSATGVSRRVLLVDDSEIGARANAALVADGVQVARCSPADDVATIALRFRPDVVLVHAAPEDVQALLACVEVRRADLGSPVIAYRRGYAGEGTIRRVLASGADDYVVDSGTGRELCERVAAQLRHVRDGEVMRWARARRSSLRDIANTDPLTGMANRRAVTRALGRALVLDGAVSLILVDIDHLRRVNASAGHPAGDRVLRHVARGLAEAMPREGTAGRWGGDEFAIVLREAAHGLTELLGERLRRAVADLCLPELAGVPRITASVGGARSEGVAGGRSSEGLIAGAETALSRSKQAGRNCVHVMPVAAE